MGISPLEALVDSRPSIECFCVVTKLSVTASFILIAKSADVFFHLERRGGYDSRWMIALILQFLSIFILLSKDALASSSFKKIDLGHTTFYFVCLSAF